jgi:hypothetical protein
VADWVQLLEALRDGRLDIAAAVDLPRLNQDLDRLIGPSAVEAGA